MKWREKRERKKKAEHGDEEDDYGVHKVRKQEEEIIRSLKGVADISADEQSAWETGQYTHEWRCRYTSSVGARTWSG